MRPWSLLVSCVLAVGLALFPCRSPAADAPYPVEIWADASYDVAGRLVELDFPQKADYPAAFLENLRQRVAARPATPYLQAGQPATFETGVRIQLTVTPGAGGGSVSVDGITLAPRVLRMTVAKLPGDISRSGDWDGVVMARCEVTAKGRCSQVEVVEANGLAPATARDLARRSLEGWRFKPQRADGKAIVSPTVVAVRVEKEGVARPVLRDREY